MARKIKLGQQAGRAKKATVELGPEGGVVHFRVKTFDREMQDDLEEIGERMDDARQDGGSIADFVAAVAEQLDVMLEPLPEQELPEGKDRDTLASTLVLEEYHAEGSELTADQIMDLVDDIAKAARP